MRYPEPTDQETLFLNVFKDSVSKTVSLNDRALFDEHSINRTASGEARHLVVSMFKRIKAPEFRQTYCTSGSIQIPATWFDHLKQTVSVRFPRLKMKIVHRSIETKVSVTLAIDRTCPHHSIIASDHHCERFMTSQWKDVAPVFDMMSEAPVYAAYNESEVRFEKPYRLELAPDVWKAARRLIQDHSHKQSVLDFLANASDRDKNAYLYPMLVELWELVTSQPWIPGQDPSHYIDDWKFMGLKVVVNEHLPAGSWRIL